MVDPTLLAICRPCPHDVVDVIPFRIEDDGQHPTCARRADHQELAGVPLADEMRPVADLLHLFRENLTMALGLSLDFGGDGDGGRYDLERCQALVPSPQTCFLSRTASSFETCRLDRTRSSPLLRPRLLEGRAPAAERGPQRSTATTSGRSLTCRGVARQSDSICVSASSTADSWLARGGSSPNGCRTSSLRTLGGRRDLSRSSAFWPLRWEVSLGPGSLSAWG